VCGAGGFGVRVVERFEMFLELERGVELVLDLVHGEL